MTTMAGFFLLNGRVFTARAGEPPFTGGVAIVGERIVAVGGDAAARAAAPLDARQIDGNGRSIPPGFVDAHHHLAFTEAELAAVDVRYPGVASIADLVGRIAEAAERTPDGTWIRAVGMNPEMYRDGRLPTRLDIDGATRVHPVLVQHMSGHHALANSLGLERRGLDDTAADPEGGHLIRDDRGRLTGYCLDAAQQLVVPAAVDIGHHGPGVHDDAPLEEIVGDIDRGVRASLAAGITSIVDAQVTRRELNGYRVARERGLLGVRLTAMRISSQLDAFEALGLAGRFGDDRLAIGPMKFYADGALTGGTASFTTPYGPEGDLRAPCTGVRRRTSGTRSRERTRQAGRSASTLRATEPSTGCSTRTRRRFGHIRVTITATGSSIVAARAPTSSSGSHSSGSWSSASRAISGMPAMPGCACSIPSGRIGCSPTAR